eukprot:364839-Chlamydomonas_euryale.AAC.3
MVSNEGFLAWCPMRASLHGWMDGMGEACCPTCICNAAIVPCRAVFGLLVERHRGLRRIGCGCRVQIARLGCRDTLRAFPVVLDYDSFEMAVADASRIMPGMDLPKTLRTNPSMIMGLMKGRSMIPYDQISNPWS